MCTGRVLGQIGAPDKPERQALSTKHARHVLVSPCFGQFQFQCRATHHVRYPKIGDFLANMSHEIRTPMNTINRDAQFHYLNEQIQDAQQRGEPVISVDTKKKELVGDFKNPGRARARFRRPRTRQGDPLPITVCHYPPGTSKWNKIEHRLFSHIAMNWRGKALTSLATIVSLIGSTTTTTVLRVRSEIDKRSYPKGVTVSDTSSMPIGTTRSASARQTRIDHSFPCAP